MENQEKFKEVWSGGEEDDGVHHPLQGQWYWKQDQSKGCWCHLDKSRSGASSLCSRPCFFILPFFITKEVARNMMIGVKGQKKSSLLSPSLSSSSSDLDLPSPPTSSETGEET